MPKFAVAVARGMSALAIVASFSLAVYAQPDAPQPSPDERMAKVETDVKDAALAGHNAWMLTSSALVLFMTAPGLAMFYSGLVRKKNVLGVMMQCIFLMGLMTVIWGTYGYSLAFGGKDKYIGNADYLFMKGVERHYDAATNSVVTPMFNEGQPFQIPRLTHMLFQGMFFIITPALICGAFAERMKFSTMVVFMILWGTLVYIPLAHWVWGGGILAFVPLKEGTTGNGIAGGALDFAGGTVVHISSGVSALICALVMGKRLGYGSEPMPPHNLTYTVLGAGMLWVGWFGFNAGSELASVGLASSAFCVTHFAAAAGVHGRPWNGLCGGSRACWALRRASSRAWSALRPLQATYNPCPRSRWGWRLALSAFWLARN